MQALIFIFLPIVFILHWFVCGRNLRAQNGLIVLASYAFYAWWDWRFLALLAGTSLLCWSCGLAVARWRESAPRRALFFNALNIVANLGVLALFKYYDFFAQSFADAFLGGNASGILLHLALPVGISFYTFKALAYTIEIRRGTIPAERDPMPVLAYISFFPQLLAGPIERPQHLIPQFKQLRTFSYEQATDGCRQILWGLFKKVVVADNCAVYVNEVWGNVGGEAGSTLLLAAILFSVQIYGDFSGYSDISIGVGKLLGVRSRKNFDMPYFSRGIAEFWRKWHISLTSWFRDYVYIPMGGSRCPKGRVIFNTLVVFLLSGLWHGADWTFVLWGAYNGLLFVPGLLSGHRPRYRDSVAQGRMLPSLKELGLMLFTFGLATLGWILFRTDNLQQAGAFFEGLGHLGTLKAPLLFFVTPRIRLQMVCICCLLVAEWTGRKNPDFSGIRTRYKILNWCLYLAIAILVFWFWRNDSAFIYQQF